METFMSIAQFDALAIAVVVVYLAAASRFVAKLPEPPA
jgi:hypothetical protein